MKVGVPGGNSDRWTSPWPGDEVEGGNGEEGGGADIEMALSQRC